MGLGCASVCSWWLTLSMAMANDARKRYRDISWSAGGASGTQPRTVAFVRLCVSARMHARVFLALLISACPLLVWPSFGIWPQAEFRRVADRTCPEGSCLPACVHCQKPPRSDLLVGGGICLALGQGCSLKELWRRRRLKPFSHRFPARQARVQDCACRAGTPGYSETPSISPGGGRIPPGLTPGDRLLCPTPVAGHAPRRTGCPARRTSPQG